MRAGHFERRGMATYHLSVKTISRSAGRSATAAAAYRAGAVIACERYGVEHDYSRKSGVAHVEIVAPADAPDWARDRAALWNAVEAKETRKNSVVAREWEVALPHELDADQRREIVTDFARELVARYGVVADVAIHAPGREGDQRNHHAHILTTTRAVGPEGLEAKTRVLDAAKTGGVEIDAMRQRWAEIANAALERAGRSERIDHRSLDAQRGEAEQAAEAARERGDAPEAARQEQRAEALDRLPEPKLGVAAVAMERRAKRQAAREGRDYEPVTERGAAVQESRAERSFMAEARDRLEAARGAYAEAREEGQNRRSAAREAMRAMLDQERARERRAELARVLAAEKQREAERQAQAQQEREAERQRQSDLEREQTRKIQRRREIDRDIEL